MDDEGFTDCEPCNERYDFCYKCGVVSYDSILEERLKKIENRIANLESVVSEVSALFVPVV